MVVAHLVFGYIYSRSVSFYKGVAKYVSDFVGINQPRHSPRSPSGVSGGSKLTKITDGAVVLMELMII